MAGNWHTINLPATVASGAAFGADMMLLLTDGSVLIHNAYGKEWLRFRPDAVSGYQGANWSTTYQESDMTNTRQYFASGILRDGKVFAIGGEDSSAGGDTPLGETFDPQSNTWSALSKPAAFDFVRGDCNGAILANGDVLVGGATPSGPPPTWSKRTAIWNPVSNTWTEAGLRHGTLAATDKEDPFEEEGFALLHDGSVLAAAVRDTPKAQRYVPSLDAWVDCSASPVNLAIGTLLGTDVFEIGPTLVLPSGKALTIGGTGQTAIFTHGGTATAPGSWTQGPAFPADTSVGAKWPTLTALDAPGCVLPSGRVVTMGGTTAPDGGGYFSQNPVFLEYDPAGAPPTMPKLDVQPTLPAGTFTWECNFLLLPTGQFLCSAHGATLFLYTPDPATAAPHHSWRPSHISVHHSLTRGHSHELRGRHINGLSQAVCYGDDGGMATNYPIVRLSNGSGVHYMRSYDFSTMGIATGPAEHSCHFHIPASLPAGKYHLDVVANGIASEPIHVHVT